METVLFSILCLVLLLALFFSGLQNLAAKRNIQALELRNAKLNARLNQASVDREVVQWPETPASRAAKEIARALSLSDGSEADLEAIIQKHHPAH